MKANHNYSHVNFNRLAVVSKIVEKKNESKSQQQRPVHNSAPGCVKDRWEKEWKQITTRQHFDQHHLPLCQRSLRKRMKANHNWEKLLIWQEKVVSKIVEKKNESKSQLEAFAGKSRTCCVKDRWEKEWKQITTLLNLTNATKCCVKDRWEKEWKQITTGNLERLPQLLVVSKIVEKKNESKSQLLYAESIKFNGCVKDRWEKEWKQITTQERECSTASCCVKDRWEKEWKQITTSALCS